MRQHKKILIFAAALLLGSFSPVNASAPPAGSDSQSDLSRIVDETTKPTIDNPTPAQPPQQSPDNAAAQPVPIPVDPSESPPDVAGMAQDKAAADGKSAATIEYGPPDCDFRVNLPGTPETLQRCDKDNPDRCNALTTYTHVFELQSTVTFTISCNPTDKTAYDHYSGDVMRAALARIAKDKLEKFETAFQRYDVAKEAALLGTIKSGGSDGIYVAQLWIGHNSIFTIEGQMLGADREDANKMFVDVLRTMRYKDWPLDKNGAVDIPKSAVIAETPPTAPSQQAPAAGTPKTDDKPSDKDAAKPPETGKPADAPKDGQDKNGKKTSP